VLTPKFHGLAGEDPHKHLEEFHVVCSTMKLRAFPFTAIGAFLGRPQQQYNPYSNTYNPRLRDHPNLR